ncbi:low temperature requirement protein A [Streptomyces sp. NPDC006430]|uniref:low temperature requirement protein A n=1 Tax=Streptomyces sp. NPDC006430 TaxID=3154299 RepID=UPI0033B15C82
MTESAAAESAPADGERHASWLELFFDLTAVAGVAQLAHLLRGDPGGDEVALYAVMFVAAASQVAWDAALYGVGAGAFLLPLLLWSLSLRHGANGVPLLARDAFRSGWSCRCTASWRAR